MAHSSARFFPGSGFLTTHLLRFVCVILGLLACDLGSLVTSNPSPIAIITAPPSGSAFREGDDIAIQSTATDAQAITRVELSVDGQTIRTDTPPQATNKFSLAQTWRAVPGTHVISVRAYNAQNIASAPAAISVQVARVVVVTTVPSPIALPTDALTLTTTASGVTPSPATGECVNSAAFIADVTIPDGTVVAVGASHTKTWRLKNNGTCPWGAGYQLIFVSGDAMSAESARNLPSTLPGATTDLSIPIIAPNASGTRVGNWRLRSPSGVLFGPVVTVVINVSNTAASVAQNPSGPCSGAPNITSFTANPGTIAMGSSATLEWGVVQNADSVEIDQGIDEVGTPGSVTVTPLATTTYTISARCGPNGTLRRVTITVNSASNDIVPAGAHSPSASELYVAVNYYYNGDHGTANIALAAYAEDSANNRVPAAQTFEMQGAVVLGSSSAAVKIRRTSPGAAVTSTQIRVCMYVTGGGAFYCEVHPYDKTW